MEKNIRIVVCLCVGLLLVISLLPVEQSWNNSYRLLSIAIAVCGTTGAMMVIASKKPIRLTAIDIIVCTWFVYVMIRIWTDGAYPCNRFSLNATLAFSLYISLRLIFSSALPKQEIIAVGIILCSIYEFASGIYQMIDGSSRHHLYLLTGTFFNPGPYAAYIMLGLVMAVALYNDNGNDSGNGNDNYPHSTLNRLLGATWSIVTILLLAAILPATLSRSAMLSAATVLILIYRRRLGRKIWHLITLLAVIGIAAYFMKRGSADGRGMIYYISLLCLAGRPLFGSGIGSFFHQYAETTAVLAERGNVMLYNVDVIDYSFNSLLHIGVEQGLTGIALAIALLACVLIKLRNRGAILAYGLLSLVIFSLFSYPFHLLPYQIIMTIITAYAATAGGEKKERHPVASYLCAVALLTVVVVLSSITIPLTRQRVVAENTYRDLLWQNDDKIVMEYRRLYPILSDDKRFLFAYGKKLSTMGHYNESNSILRQGSLISNDPMFYIVQGNNYQAIGAYAEAEETYRKAHHVVPNRLYSLYKLMLLYQETGEREKLLNAARHVLSFEVKVQSPATDEMKATAAKVLKEINCVPSC